MSESNDRDNTPLNPFKKGTKEVEPVSGSTNPSPSPPPSTPSAADRSSIHGGSTDVNRGADDAAEGTETREITLGKELAKQFKEKNVHPVLIFGSKGSGKTSLIASLVRYMIDRRDADASVELDESIFPIGDQWWEETVNWSRDLFYKKILAYIEDNAAPEATLVPQPFFLPIKLTRKSGEVALYAFLEGKGEWYQPNLSADVPFRKFRGFLQGVLQNFNAAATAIYIAPFVTGSSPEPADSPHLRASDLGLRGALEQYLSSRKAYLHLDQHLFLITKWDVFCASIASPSFIEPSDGEIQAVLHERYPLSWIRYLNSHLSSESQNKGYSVYCSGLIDGKTIVVPAEDDYYNVVFYARKLWDLLYENSHGGVLYPDVRPKPPSPLDRALKWLRG